MATALSKLVFACGIIAVAGCDAGTSSPLENAVTGISIHLGNTTGVGLNLGDSLRLSPTLTFALPGQHATPAIQYRSSDPTVVAIDSEGRITAVGYGAAWIFGSVMTSGHTFTDSLRFAVGKSVLVNANETANDRSRRWLLPVHRRHPLPVRGELPAE